MVRSSWVARSSAVQNSSLRPSQGRNQLPPQPRLPQSRLPQLRLDQRPAAGDTVGTPLAVRREPEVKGPKLEYLFRWVTRYIYAP